MSITINSHSNTGRNRHFDNCGDVFYQPVVDGKEHSMIAETEDMAMLIGLAIKYDGLSSQFPKMAARMLGIESEWAK